MMKRIVAIMNTTIIETKKTIGIIDRSIMIHYYLVLIDKYCIFT